MPLNADLNNVIAKFEDMFPNKCQVTYEPAFPLPDKSTRRFFQVVIAIGPGDDDVLNGQVHECVPSCLNLIRRYGFIEKVDTIGLRFRRYENNENQRPFMYIEMAWDRENLLEMAKEADFGNWQTWLRFYRNHCDNNDPFIIERINI